MELAGRDAAEGDAFEMVFIGASHDISIARSQLLPLQLRRDAVRNDWPDGMDDVFAWQIVCLGDFSLACRLGMTLMEHDFVAFLTELYACEGMDGVVDAIMQRSPAAQHLAVGGVDDGVDL